MLRFSAGVFCHVFRFEIARVLSHASMWSEIAGVGVDVNALADRAHSPNSLHGWDLAVDLDTVGDHIADLQQLHGYLARNLSPEYDVVLESDHVHVEWDARRRPAQVTPVFERVPTSPARA